MSVEIWTDAGDGGDPQEIWMARDGFVDLVQGRFLPFETRKRVQEQVDGALARGLEGAVRADDGEVYVAVGRAAEDLARSHPAFLKAAEAPYLDTEEAALAANDADVAPRRYRLRMTTRILELGLTDFGALHLWLPVPLHVPGKQEVKLLQASPPDLTEAWVPEAGQFYNVPILLDRRAPVPDLTAEFEVLQVPVALRALRDDDLVWRPRRLAPALRKALDAWIEQRFVGVGQVGDQSPAGILDVLLNAMDTEMVVNVLPAGSGDLLDGVLSTGAGDVPALTEFLAVVLSRLGLGARTGRGLALPLKDGEAHLSFPTGDGFGHAFLQWRHPESGEAGTLDLNYLRRWRKPAGALDGEDGAFFSRLARVGEEARSRMRRGLYPGELILAGRPPSSQVRFLKSGQTHRVPAPVRTEIHVNRLSEATRPC